MGIFHKKTKLEKLEKNCQLFYTRLETLEDLYFSAMNPEEIRRIGCNHIGDKYILVGIGDWGLFKEFQYFVLDEKPKRFMGYKDGKVYFSDEPQNPLIIIFFEQDEIFHEYWKRLKNESA